MIWCTFVISGNGSSTTLSIYYLFISKQYGKWYACAYIKRLEKMMKLKVASKNYNRFLHFTSIQSFLFRINWIGGINNCKIQLGKLETIVTFFFGKVSLHEAKKFSIFSNLNSNSSNRKRKWWKYFRKSLLSNINSLLTYSWKCSCWSYSLEYNSTQRYVFPLSSLASLNPWHINVSQYTSVEFCIFASMKQKHVL